MRKRFLWFSLLVLVLDQLSKTVVNSSMKMGESISVVGNFFRLTYVLNPGGAFGTRLGNNIFYTTLSVVVILIAFYFFFRNRREDKLLQAAFSLVLGGALGNLLDRIRYGEVLDFLDFNFFNIQIPPFTFGFISFSGFCLNRWPIFNIADSAVTVGMVLILWYIIKPGKKSTSSEIKMAG